MPQNLFVFTFNFGEGSYVLLIKFDVLKISEHINYARKLVTCAMSESDLISGNNGTLGLTCRPFVQSLTKGSRLPR